MTAGELVLVTLNAPPALEESIVDWLLERGAGQGFTQSVVFGHSSQHTGLTVAEQVSGRRRRVRFDVSISAAALDAFLGELDERFATSDLYYRVVPVLAEKHLGQSPGSDGH